MNMKSTSWCSVAFLPALLCLTACQENFDKRLQREAREFTENHCPQEPEPGTRLDSTSYEPDGRVYTLWYSLAAENEAAIRQQKELMHRLLLHELVADVNYINLKKEGVTFRYVYRSQQNGAPVYDTQIKPQEYRAQ